ncbi:DUF3302 domain-containing protein [Xanthobacter sp. V0B-10]|uniref:DUF3302 domain-containing protein n=1 Tax=Xanthobacter albus TaxID=3119929 RepID=UPI003728870A
MGFVLDGWDYAALLGLSIIALSGLLIVIFILGLPGRIAIGRNHPEADAVYTMGWLGFLGVVPWINAFIWAFKPTEVVDLRYTPRQVKKETQEMIARLKGATPLAFAAKPDGETTANIDE